MLSDLALRAKTGDQEAFVSLASHFAPYLKRLISSFLFTKEEKEDLKQEGLVGLYRAVLLFDPDRASFSTYAPFCIRSAVLDAIRRFHRNGKMGEISTEELEAIPASLTTTPERVLMGKEEIRDLVARMDRVLSPTEQAVFHLLLKGNERTRIAKILGKDQKSVDNTLFRIRKKLSPLSD